MPLGLPKNIFGASVGGLGGLPANLMGQAGPAIKGASKALTEGFGPTDPDIDQMSEALPEQSQGLLYSAGRGLDYFGRGTRGLLMGEGWDPNGAGDVSGWDILNKIGFGEKQKKYGEYSGWYEGLVAPDTKGFGYFNPLNYDLMDFLAFGVEVVTDPLTYVLGGMGQMGKGTRMVSKVQKLETKALARASVAAGLEAAARNEIKQAGQQAMIQMGRSVLGARPLDAVLDIHKSLAGKLKGVARSQLGSKQLRTVHAMKARSAHELITAGKIRQRLSNTRFNDMLKEAPDMKQALRGDYRGTFDHVKGTVSDILKSDDWNKGTSFDTAYDASQEAIERMGRGSWAERLWTSAAEGHKSGRGRFGGMWDEVKDATRRQYGREREAIDKIIRGDTSRAEHFLTLGLPSIGGPVTHGLGRTATRIARLITRPLAGSQAGLSKFGPKFGKKAASLRRQRHLIEQNGIEVSLAATIDDILEGYVTGRLGGGTWFGSALSVLKKDFIPEVNLIRNSLTEGIFPKAVPALVEHAILRLFRGPIALIKEGFETSQIPKVWRRYFKTGLKDSPHVEGLREAMEFAAARGILDANDMANTFQSHIARLADEPAIKDWLKEAGYSRQIQQEISDYARGQATEIGPDAGMALQDIVSHFDTITGHANHRMVELIEGEAAAILAGTRTGMAAGKVIPPNMADYFLRGLEGVKKGAKLSKLDASIDELADPDAVLKVEGDIQGILVDDQGNLIAEGGIRDFVQKDLDDAIRKGTRTLQVVEEQLELGYTLAKNTDTDEAKQLLASWDDYTDYEKIYALAQLPDNTVDPKVLKWVKDVTEGHNYVGEQVLFMKGETPKQAATRIAKAIYDQTPGYSKTEAGIGSIKPRGKAKGKEPWTGKKAPDLDAPEVQVGTEVYVRKAISKDGKMHQTRKVEVYKRDDNGVLKRSGEIEVPYYEKRLIKSKHPWGDSGTSQRHMDDILLKMFKLAKNIGALEEMTGIKGIHNFDTFKEFASGQIVDFASLEASDVWKAFKDKAPDMAERVRVLWWEPMFWNPKSRHFATSMRSSLDQMARGEFLAGLKAFYDPANLEEYNISKSSIISPDHPTTKLRLKRVKNSQGETTQDSHKYYYERKPTYAEAEIEAKKIFEEQEILYEKQGATFDSSPEALKNEIKILMDEGIETELPLPKWSDVPEDGLKLLNEEEVMKFGEEMGILDDMVPVDNWVEGVGFYYPRILSDDARTFMHNHPELFDNLIKGIKAGFKDSTISGRFMNMRRIKHALTSDVGLIDVLKDFNGATLEFFNKIKIDTPEFGRAGYYNNHKIPKSIMEGRLFENDPVKALILRQLAADTAINHAYFLQASIHMFAKPVGSKFRGPGIKVLDAVDKLGSHFNWMTKAGAVNTSARNLPHSRLSMAGERFDMPVQLASDAHGLGQGLPEGYVIPQSGDTAINELHASLMTGEATHGRNVEGLPGSQTAKHSDFEGFGAQEEAALPEGHPHANRSTDKHKNTRLYVDHETAENLTRTDPSAVRSTRREGPLESDTKGTNPWDMASVIEAINSASAHGRPRPQVFEGHMVRTLADEDAGVAESLESTVRNQPSPVEYPNWHPIKQLAYERYHGRQWDEANLDGLAQDIKEGIDAGVGSGEFKFRVLDPKTEEPRDFHFEFKETRGKSRTGPSGAFQGSAEVEKLLTGKQFDGSEFGDHGLRSPASQSGEELADRMDQADGPPPASGRGWPSLRTEADTIEGAFVNSYRKYFGKLEGLDDAGRKRLREEGVTGTDGFKLIPSAQEFSEISQHHKNFWEQNLRPIIDKGIVTEEAAAFLRLFLKDFGTEQMKYLSVGKGSILAELLPEHYGMWGRTKALRKPPGADRLTELMMGAAKSETYTGPLKQGGAPLPPVTSHASQIDLHPGLKDTPIAAQVLVLTHEIGHVMSRMWSKDHQHVVQNWTSTSNLAWQQGGGLKEMIRNYMQLPGRNINSAIEGAEFESFLDQYTAKAQENPEELFAIMFSHSLMRRKIPAALAEGMGPAGLDMMVNVQRTTVQKLKDIAIEVARHVKNDWPAELRKQTGHFENTEATRELKNQWYTLRREWEMTDVIRMNMDNDGLRALSRHEINHLGRLEEQMTRIENKLKRHHKERFGLYHDQSKVTLEDIGVITPEHTDLQLKSNLSEHAWHMVKYTDAVMDWWIGMEGSAEEVLETITRRQNRVLFADLFPKDASVKEISKLVAGNKAARVIQGSWAKVNGMDSKLDTLHRRLTEVRDVVINQSDGLQGAKAEVLREARQSIDNKLNIIKGRLKQRQAFNRTLEDLWDGDNDPLKIIFDNVSKQADIYGREAVSDETLSLGKKGLEAFDRLRTAIDAHERIRGTASLDDLKGTEQGQRQGRRTGEEVFPSNIIQDQEFKKFMDYANDLLGRHADILDDFEETLIGSGAANTKISNSFRFHNVPYSDELVIGLDNIDVDYWLRYMEADIAWQRFGQRGLSDLFPEEWGGTPGGTAMDMENIANTRSYFLSIFDMLHGEDTLGRNILKNVNYRRSAESPEMLLQQIMPDLVKEKDMSFASVIPENFWAYFQWLKKHKNPGYKMPTLDQWLQGEIKSNSNWLMSIVMDMNKTRAQVFARNNTPYTALEQKMGRGGPFPDVANMEDLRWRDLPDEFKMKMMNDYLMDNGINPYFVKSFILSRFNDPRWKIMGGNLVPRQRYTKFNNGQVYAVKDMQNVLGQTGMQGENVMTVVPPAQAAGATEQMLGNHDVFYREIMSWIDNARSQLRETQMGQQAVPIGTKRRIGWDNPMIRGVATRDGVIASLDSAGAIDLNDPIAKMSHPIGAVVDPIGSRLFPNPHYGKGGAGYGKSFNIADDVAMTSQFQETLLRDTISLIEELKSLKRVRFNKQRIGKDFSDDMMKDIEEVLEGIKNGRDYDRIPDDLRKITSGGQTGIEQIFMGAAQGEHIATGGIASGWGDMNFRIENPEIENQSLWGQSLNVDNVTFDPESLGPRGFGLEDHPTRYRRHRNVTTSMPSGTMSPMTRAQSIYFNILESDGTILILPGKRGDKSILNLPPEESATSLAYKLLTNKEVHVPFKKAKKVLSGSQKIPASGLEGYPTLHEAWMRAGREPQQHLLLYLDDGLTENITKAEAFMADKPTVNIVGPRKSTLDSFKKTLKTDAAKEKEAFGIPDDARGFPVQRPTGPMLTQNLEYMGKQRAEFLGVPDAFTAVAKGFKTGTTQVVPRGLKVGQHVLIKKTHEGFMAKKRMHVSKQPEPLLVKITGISEPLEDIFKGLSKEDAAEAVERWSLREGWSVEYLRENWNRFKRNRHIQFELAETPAPGSLGPGAITAEGGVTVLKVISGGQVGADQIGLEVAQKLGIETGGMAPHGFETVKGAQPERLQNFGLTAWETAPASRKPRRGERSSYYSELYKPRTKHNVDTAAREGGGTILFYQLDQNGRPIGSPGTNLTKGLADEAYRSTGGAPPLVNPKSADDVKKWISQYNVKTVNVAGSRKVSDKQVRDILHEGLGGSKVKAAYPDITGQVWDIEMPAFGKNKGGSYQVTVDPDSGNIVATSAIFNIFHGQSFADNFIGWVRQRGGELEKGKFIKGKAPPPQKVQQARAAAKKEVLPQAERYTDEPLDVQTGAVDEPPEGAVIFDLDAEIKAEITKREAERGLERKLKADWVGTPDVEDLVDELGSITHGHELFEAYLVKGMSQKQIQFRQEFLRKKIDELKRKRDERGFAIERQKEFGFMEDDIPPRPVYTPYVPAPRRYDFHEPVSDRRQRAREDKRAAARTLARFKKEDAEWVELYGATDERGFPVRNDYHSVYDPSDKAKDLAEAIFRNPNKTPRGLLNQMSTLQKVALGSASTGTFKNHLRLYYSQLKAEFNNPGIRNNWAKWKIDTYQKLEKLFKPWEVEGAMMPKLPNWSVAEEVQVARNLTTLDAEQIISPIGMGGRPRPELTEGIEEFAAGIDSGRAPGAFVPEQPMHMTGGEFFVPDFKDARRIATRVLKQADGVSPKTQAEIDDLVMTLGEYEFRSYIAKKLVDHVEPTQPIKIPIGGLQQKMETLFDPTNLSGADHPAMAYGGGHLTPEMMREAEGPFMNPRMWEGMGMDMPIPTRLPVRDEDRWWSAMHGYSTIPEQPTSHLVGPIRHGDTTRWRAMFSKYKDEILRSSGMDLARYKKNPEALEQIWQNTIDDFLTNRKWHRVDPVKSHLFVPGQMEGPGSLLGRVHMRHQPGSDIFNKPGLHLNKYYDTYRKLIRDERYREKDPWNNDDWRTPQEKDLQRQFQHWVKRVEGWNEDIDIDPRSEGSFTKRIPGERERHESYRSMRHSKDEPKRGWRIRHVGGMPYMSSSGKVGGKGAGKGKGGGKRLYIPIGSLNDPSLLFNQGLSVGKNTITRTGPHGVEPNPLHVWNIQPQINHYHNVIGSRIKSLQEMGRWQYVWDPKMRVPDGKGGFTFGGHIKAFYVDPKTGGPTKLTSGERALPPPTHPLERIEPMPSAFGPVAGGGISKGGKGIATVQDLAYFHEWLHRNLEQLPNGDSSKGMPDFSGFLEREIQNHRLWPELTRQYKFIHNRHASLVPHLKDTGPIGMRGPALLTPQQEVIVKAAEESGLPGTAIHMKVDEVTGKNVPAAGVAEGAGDVTGSGSTFKGHTENVTDVGEAVEAGSAIRQTQLEYPFDPKKHQYGRRHAEHQSGFTKGTPEDEAAALERGETGKPTTIEQATPAQAEAMGTIGIQRQEAYDRIVLALSEQAQRGESGELFAGKFDRDKIRNILKLIGEHHGELTRVGKEMDIGAPPPEFWDELYDSGLIPESTLDEWANEVSVDIGGGRVKSAIKVTTIAEELAEQARGGRRQKYKDIEDLDDQYGDGNWYNEKVGDQGGFMADLMEDAHERGLAAERTNRGKAERQAEFGYGEQPQPGQVIRGGQLEQSMGSLPYIMETGKRGGRWIRRPLPLTKEAHEGLLGGTGAAWSPPPPTQSKYKYLQQLGEEGRTPGQPSVLPFEADEEQLLGLARRIANMSGGESNVVKTEMVDELRRRLSEIYDPESTLTPRNRLLSNRGATSKYEMRTWPSENELKDLHRNADWRAFPSMLEQVESLRNQVNRKPWYEIEQSAADKGRRGGELERVLGDPMFGNDIQPFMTKGHHGMAGLSGEAAQAAEEGFWHSDVPTVSLAKYLSESDLRTFMHPETRQLVQVSNNIDEMGSILRHYGLDKYGIPTQIYNDLIASSKNIKHPAKMGNFIKNWGKLNALIKGALTQFYPAFYLRNIFSDFMLSFMSNGFDAATFGDAVNIAFGRDVELKSVTAGLRKGVAEGAATTGDIHKHLMSGRVFQGGKYAQFVDELQGVGYEAEFNQLTRRLSSGKTLKEASGAASKEGKVLPKIKESIFNKLGVFKWLFERTVPEQFRAHVKNLGLREIVQIGEKFTRSAHFLARMRAGDSMDAALRHTRVHLLDYSDLTQFEKEIMSNTVLFYSWSRKIIPRLYDNFFDSPAKVAFVLRGTTAPSVERDEILPEWIRKSAAIPYGKDGYVYGLGSPFEELNKFDWTTSTHSVPKNMTELLESVGEVFRKGIAQTNPFIKGTVELATGEDLFYGKAWEGMDRLGPEWWLLQKMGFPVEEQTLPGGFKRHRMDAGFNFLTRTAPIGRMVKEAGTVTDIFSGAFGSGDIDPMRNSLESLVKFGTGIKYAPKGEREQLWAKEQYLQRLMETYQREGKAGKVPIYFPIGDGSDDPNLEFYIDMIKKIGKRKKKLAEERRGLGGGGLEY